MPRGATLLEGVTILDVAAVPEASAVLDRATAPEGLPIRKAVRMPLIPLYKAGWGRRRLVLAVPRRRVLAFRRADAIVREIIDGLMLARRAEARIGREEAADLAWLVEGGRVESLAYLSIVDFARERLQMSERTARERVALHRALRAAPEAEHAYLEGRLTGCQVLAIAPMLARGDPGDRLIWIARAETLTVRDLKQLIREVKDAQADPRDPEDFRSFRFTAPVGAAIAFDRMIDFTRKVIGYDAPRFECIDAILAETGWAGRGEVAAGGEAIRCRRAIPSRLRIRPSGIPTAALVEARRTIRDLREFHEDLDDLIVGETTTPNDVAARLRSIRLLRNPLRVLLGRLLRSMRRTRSLRALGFDSLEEFAEEYLGISPRLARELASESFLFERRPEIEEAFALGRIGIGKAWWIDRLAIPRNIDRWIARGEALYSRYFEREARFLELLRKCDRHLGFRFAGPFPHADLEGEISSRLRERFGWTEKTLRMELRKRGIRRMPANGAIDPAENPALMRRYEALLELLSLEVFTEPPVIRSADPSEKRQMFAPAGHRVTITIRAPAETIADLSVLIREFRGRYGLSYEPYVPILLAMRDFYDVWKLADPEREPSQDAILRRDEHRCVFPGCTRRGPLEAHHVRPRSRGGKDRQSNITGICFGHHRRVIHEGHGWVSGEAPHALRFELGRRPDGTPLVTTLGGRIIDHD